MRRFMAVAFVALLAVGPMPGRAEASGCGGTWLGSGTCEFVYQGQEIEVTGEVLGGGVLAITLDAPGPVLGQPRIVLLPHCVVAPSGSCVHQSGPLVSIPKGTVITCRANGLGTGTYSCRNLLL